MDSIKERGRKGAGREKAGIEGREAAGGGGGGEIVGERRELDETGSSPL